MNKGNKKGPPRRDSTETGKRSTQDIFELPACDFLQEEDFVFMEDPPDIVSGHQFIKKSQDCQSPLLAVLPQGAQNALTAKELCGMLDIDTPRMIAQQVQQLRRAGVPVCSSTDSSRPGYYLPASVAELQAFYKSLMHRRRELSETCNAVEASLSQLSGQAFFGGVI